MIMVFPSFSVRRAEMREIMENKWSFVSTEKEQNSSVSEQERHKYDVLVRSRTNFVPSLV